MKLSTEDHDRRHQRWRHVYLVLSRRAGGVSVGVNVNTNDACNWRCIYCQVPGLSRGGAPRLDPARLAAELSEALAVLADGSWFAGQGLEIQPVRDISLSGNGESTTSGQFAEVVQAMIAARAAAGLPELALTVISNGSMIGRPEVRRGLQALGEAGGELWFKFDRATPAGMALVNGRAIDPRRHLRHLGEAAQLCPVWVQTCWFAIDGAPPDQAEEDAWLEAVAGQPVRGVLLYGLARSSHQPGAGRLSRLPREHLDALAGRVRARGMEARVYY